MLAVTVRILGELPPQAIHLYLQCNQSFPGMAGKRGAAALELVVVHDGHALLLLRELCHCGFILYETREQRTQLRRSVQLMHKLADSFHGCGGRSFPVTATASNSKTPVWRG